MGNKLCLWAALDLLNCDFKLTLDAKIQPVFTGRKGSCFWLFSPWSRSTSNFYALIGQNLTGEFMRKIYAASGNLFTDSWSRQSFVSSCDALTVFFHWMYKMTCSCLQDSSDIHGWFVYWVFVWELRRLSKSLEIR